MGGAFGWMLGTPLSLEFAVTAGKASAHRVIIAALAAGLGSFFGLWVGYHHVADIGAFLGTLLGDWHRGISGNGVQLGISRSAARILGPTGIVPLVYDERPLPLSLLPRSTSW